MEKYKRKIRMYFNLYFYFENNGERKTAYLGL